MKIASIILCFVVSSCGRNTSESSENLIIQGGLITATNPPPDEVAAAMVPSLETETTGAEVIRTEAALVNLSQPIDPEPVPAVTPQMDGTTSQAATTGVQAAQAAASEIESVKIGDHQLVGFDELASFEYEIPDLESEQETTTEPLASTDLTASQIPKRIQDLNTKSVALKGFMLPLKVEQGEVTEMLLLRDQSMCCFGAIPKITEWVTVKMDEAGVKPIMDQPVTMLGKLRVGEIYENGYLVGIYEMDGEKMIGPEPVH